MRSTSSPRARRGELGFRRRERRRGLNRRGGRSVGIAVSRFNGEITTLLLEGALAELEEAGVARERIDVIMVPGAFELPLGAMALAKTQAVLLRRRARMRHPRGDPAFRLRRGRGGERPAAGRAGDGRPGRLRPPHLRHALPGRGARRRRAREQGRGSGPLGSRDGRRVRPAAAERGSRPNAMRRCRRAALDGAMRRPRSRPYLSRYERSLRPCLQHRTPTTRPHYVRT